MLMCKDGGGGIYFHKMNIVYFLCIFDNIPLFGAQKIPIEVDMGRGGMPKDFVLDFGKGDSKDADWLCL